MMLKTQLVVKPLDALDCSSISRRWLIKSSGSYERQAPFFTDVCDADPKTVELLRSYFAVVAQTYGPIEMISLPNAVVTGQGAVVSVNGEIIRESVAEFVAHELTPDGFDREDGRYSVRSQIKHLIPKPCLLVKRPWFRNYGHWLVDAASILALARNICGEDQISIVVGQCEIPKMQQVIEETVRKILPQAEVLTHPDDECWQFCDLRYVTPVHVPPLFKLPDAIKLLAKAMLPVELPSRSKNLFISRSHSGNKARSLLNEDDIFEMCLQRGYEMVVPERLTVLEQAIMFASAKKVIGVKGAALSNIIFCRPNTAVMVLSPSDFPDPFFWDLCGINNLCYAEVFGKVVERNTQGMNRFYIEKERVRTMLDQV